MAIFIRLLIFAIAVAAPIIATNPANESDTCGDHTCDPRVAENAELHYKKRGCFCDELCNYYKDCCRDYNSTASAGIETPSSECRLVCKYQHPVMVIVSCPTTFKGSRTLVNKCLNDSKEDLLSSVPVTGRHKQLVYRNHYCALCNGEHNYTYWNQKLSCPKLIPTGNLTIDQLNHTDCHLSVENPYPNTSHFCSITLVKSCRNSTVGKCETENNAVVYSDEGIFYKNPHCFRCNKIPNEKLMCGDLPKWIDFATPSLLSASYFILINFNRRDVRVNGKRQLHQCPHGHWFDYVKKKCKMLLDMKNPPSGTKHLNCSLKRLEDNEYILLPNKTLYVNSSKTFIDNNSYVIKNNSEIFVCDQSKFKTVTKQLTCSHQRLDHGGYLLLPDKTLYVNSSKTFFDKDYFMIDEHGDVFICQNHKLEHVLTLVGMGISLSALSFLIVVYMLLPAIWNLTGNIYLSFSFSLFLAQMLFLISQYAGKINFSCEPMAVTMHYAFLASFFWLNVVSVNIWITVCRNPCEMTSARGMKRFLIYSLYAWLSPLLIIIPALSLDKHWPSSEFAPGYGFNGVCWLNNNKGLLLFFAIPLAVIILVNLAAYIHTAVTIYKLRKFSVQNTGKGNIKILIINTKLCLLTGITWSVGYLASVVDSKLRIVFVILNATYGLWLAICFLTSENIFSSMKHKFSRSTSHTTSTKTMS